MFANFATAITSSTAVTLALFYVMNLLISVQPGAYVEPREYFDVPWVRVPEPEDPPNATEPPPNKEFIEPPIPPTGDPPIDPNGFTPVATKFAPPPPTNKLHNVGSLGIDGPLVAIVRVQPVYPAKQQSQGVEGYVIVEFDVRTDGTVANVRVIESSHRGFERAAIRAAERFRYKPRVVDGVPLETHGIRNLFRFQMESN